MLNQQNHMSKELHFLAKNSQLIHWAFSYLICNPNLEQTLRLHEKKFNFNQPSIVILSALIVTAVVFSVILILDNSYTPDGTS